MKVIVDHGAKEPTGIQFGDVVKFDGSYLLVCQAEGCRVALMCLEEGNRWTEKQTISGHGSLDRAITNILKSDTWHKVNAEVHVA